MRIVNGVWVPDGGIWVPPLSYKQAQVYNATCPVLLVSGPRWSGKTWGCVMKTIRHLWETPGARAALFSKTTKVAKDGGVWEDIVNYGIPTWIDANLEGKTPDISFRDLQEPKIDSQTRTLSLKIENYFGGESELKLFSLDYDADVEAKVKSTRFSLIWFSELTNFEDRKILVQTKQQLRMPHLRRDQHMWIADTNPGEDGPDNVWYQIFYRERSMNDDEYPDWANTDTKKKAFRDWQKQLGLIEIMIDDNPFITEDQKDAVKADYAFDPDLYDRFVLGKWVNTGGKDRLFFDVFKPNIHVAGSTESPLEDDWEILLPSDNCFELYTTHDIGDKNHAGHIVEKIMANNRPFFHILDELVIIGEEVSLESYTQAFLEKMDFYEQYLGKKINWISYSDDSVQRYRAIIDDYDQNVILKASNGRLDLMGVEKPDGSVMQRVTLLRRLLFENRIRVSANCTATIEMLKRARKGKTKIEPVRKDQFKHPMDSLTYMLLTECALEAARPPEHTAKRSAIVAIPL